MSRLGQPYELKSLSLRNRIAMSPMCQYSVSAEDGAPNDWHFVHYASRAVGGAGLIVVEMTDVEPDGRITNRDLGLWSDEQVPAFRRVIAEMHKHGAKVAVQIGHAGRKATDAESPVGPSAIAFKGSGFKSPRALTTAEVATIADKFCAAAARAVEAGVDAIELHGAHGYLIHQFQSPLSNKREDEYGQDYAKFGVDVIRAVRRAMPADMPLLMRISAVEYADDGYGIDHAIALCRRYRDAGVDLFDVSSGGEGPAGERKPGNYPGYQVPFARAVKEALGVPVMAVGLIDDPQLAEHIVANGDADLVAVGRGMLRNPYWAVDALRKLDGNAQVARQYERGY